MNCLGSLDGGSCPPDYVLRTLRGHPDADGEAVVAPVHGTRLPRVGRRDRPSALLRLEHAAPTDLLVILSEHPRLNAAKTTREFANADQMSVRVLRPVDVAGQARVVGLSICELSHLAGDLAKPAGKGRFDEGCSG
ncbi:MAG: hypothetical protein K2X11_07780 [Acetobacteraceae bacterium]|nr:hypothetical protein [Acetobacteraceae bacterium]